MTGSPRPRWKAAEPRHRAGLRALAILIALISLAVIAFVSTAGNADLVLLTHATQALLNLPHPSPRLAVLLDS